MKHLLLSMLLAVPLRAGVEVCAVSARCPNGTVSACVITYVLPRPMCWSNLNLGMVAGEYDDPPSIPPTLWPFLVYSRSAGTQHAMTPWNFHASVLNTVTKKAFPLACKYDAELVLQRVSNRNY